MASREVAKGRREGFLGLPERQEEKRHEEVTLDGGGEAVSVDSSPDGWRQQGSYEWLQLHELTGHRGSLAQQPGSRTVPHPTLFWEVPSSWPLDSW